MKKIETVTLKELMNNSTEGSFPFMLEITHPKIVWQDTKDQENGYLRLINDIYAVKFEGKKYLPSVFSFTQPTEDGRTISNASISISTVDQRIIEIIRQIDTNPRCKVVGLFAKLDDERVSFRKLYNYEFEMSSVNWNNTSAQWELTFDPAMQLNVPRDTSTIYRNPGANESN